MVSPLKMEYTPYSPTLDVQASGALYFAERTLRRRVSVLQRSNFYDRFNGASEAGTDMTQDLQSYIFIFSRFAKIF